MNSQEYERHQKRRRDNHESVVKEIAEWMEEAKRLTEMYNEGPICNFEECYYDEEDNWCLIDDDALLPF